MPVGLRIRRPDDGRIWFDTTTSQFRYLGQIDVTGNGSIQVNEFSLGIPTYFVIPFNDDRGNSIDVSVSGTTLSWKFPVNSTTKRIIYGYRP